MGGGEEVRDLARLVVPLAGALEETGDRWLPFRLTDPAGNVVEAVSAFFADLLAAGRSEATVRSYGLDILRWFRFTWAAGVPWNMATRAEARDFCRWMQVAGKPARPHWRTPDALPEPAAGKAYAPSVRAHNETVLRCFYEFHLDAGTGPIVNPFPLDRSRRGQRAHAHHNPMEPYGSERAGLYRPSVPSRIPRSIPDEEFNEIFARLPSHRDRALVAFYVSTGARASELLSAVQGGADPGRQVITVTRKGSRAVQELPASTDAFVWLRLYQLEADGLIPKGRRQPLWWTSRRPARPLTYHAAHRMFERAAAIAGSTATLHALRHTAAYRMAEDPDLPLTDVQHVLGHAQLITTQIYTTPRQEDVIRRLLAHHAEQTRQAAARAAARARIPSGDARGAVRRPVVTVTGEQAAPVAAVACALHPLARSAGAGWPATCQDRAAVTARLGDAPFSTGGHHRSSHETGLALLLDWLEDQPGTSWQDRWLASGADAGNGAWRQVPLAWLHSHGHRTGWKEYAFFRALRIMVSADLIRPSLTGLITTVFRGGSLSVVMARHRDPDGFARLAALCSADPDIGPAAATRTAYRAALILAAKGGTLADVTTGDVLELLGVEASARGTSAGATHLFYRVLHTMGVFGGQAPPTLRELRTAGQRTPDEMIDRFGLTCRPVRDLLVDYLRERQPALDYSGLESLAFYLGGLFWADLERHHPGIGSLRLAPEIADGWKQRLRTVTRTIRGADGQVTEVSVPRVNYRECLTPVRAFYLDLACWAVEDPARWGPWVVPCPIGSEEIDRRKDKRRRKARMDARTRERLPVLPVLVATVDRRRTETAALLEAARQAGHSQQFTAAGKTLIRVIPERSAAAKTWAEDPVTGQRRDLVKEEEHAFWAFAAVEILRATGIRIEELTELSHHSLVQYRLPGTGELVPLLQIAPSKTDTERLIPID